MSLVGALEVMNTLYVLLKRNDAKHLCQVRTTAIGALLLVTDICLLLGERVSTVLCKLLESLVPSALLETLV